MCSEEALLVHHSAVSAPTWPADSCEYQCLTALSVRNLPSLLLLRATNDYAGHIYRRYVSWVVRSILVGASELSRNAFSSTHRNKLRCRNVLDGECASLQNGGDNGDIT